MSVVLRVVLTSPVGEGTVRTVRVAEIQVPDGADGLRYPSAGELAGLELTITDLVTGAVINALDVVQLLPAHGSYNSVTGVLLVNLAALDNVIVSPTLTPGWEEKHLVLVEAPGLLWVEIVVGVKKKGRVPVP